MREVLLQSARAFFLLQSATAFLLQSATGITKYDNLITKCDRYYKVRATIITNCDRYYKVWQFYYKVRQVLQSVSDYYYKVRQYRPDVLLICEFGTMHAINEIISTQADVRMKKLIQGQIFSNLGAI